MFKVEKGPSKNFFRSQKRAILPGVSHPSIRPKEFMFILSFVLAAGANYEDASQ